MSDQAHLPDEKWRPVREWEGLYEVSDQGRVRSVTRTATNFNGNTYTVQGRLRRSPAGTDGHHVVSLSNGQRRDTRSVQRMVLEAFVGPAMEGEIARHKNHDKSDNRLENLEWVDRSEDTPAPPTECPRGHPLKEPNLAKWALRQGGRHVCLACSRARSYLSYRPDTTVPLDELADDYYRKIIEKAGKQ